MAGIIASEFGDRAPYRVVAADDGMGPVFGKETRELKFSPVGERGLLGVLGLFQNLQ